MTRRRSDYELREQLVLRTLQLRHLGSREVAPTPVGIGMTPRLVPVVIGERRLGHERADARIVCGVVEDGKLLLGDGELLSRPHEPLVHLCQASLDGLLLHARSVGGSVQARSKAMAVMPASVRATRTPSRTANGWVSRAIVGTPPRASIASAI